MKAVIEVADEPVKGRSPLKDLLFIPLLPIRNIFNNIAHFAFKELAELSQITPRNRLLFTETL